MLPCRVAGLSIPECPEFVLHEAAAGTEGSWLRAFDRSGGWLGRTVNIAAFLRNNSDGVSWSGQIFGKLHVSLVKLWGMCKARSAQVRFKQESSSIPFSVCRHFSAHIAALVHGKTQ